MALWGGFGLLELWDIPAFMKWLAAGFTMTLWTGIGLGQAVAADREVRRHRSKGGAVEAFLNDPIPCLLPHLQAVGSVWSQTGCDDIYVRSQGGEIAYVQNIHFNPVTRIVTIGHFAVANSTLQGMGIGRRLAHVLRAEFAWRFKATEIRFSENSSKYISAGYPQFFASLGAVEVYPPCAIRPDWHWTV